MMMPHKEMEAAIKAELQKQQAIARDKESARRILQSIQHQLDSQVVRVEIGTRSQL